MDLLKRDMKKYNIRPEWAQDLQRELVQNVKSTEETTERWERSYRNTDEQQQVDD